MQEILKYVHDDYKFVSDEITWKVGEKWQTPNETYSLKTGDCEDGALLIYTIANYLAIPDSRIWVACGSVLGGGHSYVVYRREHDECNYVYDWCYYYSKSYKTKIAYLDRVEYNYGTKEWFRFNRTNSFKLRL